MTTRLLARGKADANLLVSTRPVVWRKLGTVLLELTRLLIWGRPDAVWLVSVCLDAVWSVTNRLIDRGRPDAVCVLESD